jgi:hypothetical protein
LAETRKAGIPGRTAWIFAKTVTWSNSTASAKSHFVMTAASAVLKIVGYLSGLSSPSVTESYQTKIFPQVIRGGAYQVPDILDKEQIERPTSHSSNARSTIAASR